jgi:hypothetical protein
MTCVRKSDSFEAMPETVRTYPRPEANVGGRLQTVVLAALVSVLFVLVFVPRSMSLDALVTPDEPLWIGRSANFYLALSNGDFEDTYQSAHPGVTTMWLGSIAFRFMDSGVAKRTGGQVETYEVRERVIPPNQLPIETLVRLRKTALVANTLVILAIFLTLVPQVGRFPAFGSAAFLSIEPLQIGFSRLLHLDALSANLLLLAVVSFTWHIAARARVGLAVSAVATGLALLTRCVNGVFLLTLAIMLAIEAVRQGRDGVSVWRWMCTQFRSLCAWAGITVVTITVLWPALWVAPASTVRRVINGGTDLASAPHHRQVLFRGEVITDDPGWMYYPVVLVFRISPLTVMGLVLAAIAILVPGAASPALRRLCLSLAVFAGTYLLILTFAAKKLDRYMLPSLATLDLVAALGAIAIAPCLVGRFPVKGRRPMLLASGLTCAVLLGGQAITARQVFPYYLNYVSPLVGGPEAATEEFSFDWGEGGKAVAEAILKHPEIGAGTLAGGAWSDYIDYYLPFQIRKASYELTPTGAAWFLNSHYLVVTEPEIQRQFYPPSMIAWFDTLEPLVTVRDEGRVYARIFDISEMAVPAPYYTPDAPIYEWNKQIRLVGSSFRPEIEAGANLRVRLYFETSGGPFYYWVEAEIVDPDGNVVGEIRKRLRSDETAAGQIASIVDVALPATLPFSEYRLQMSIRDHESGDLVKAVQVVSGRNARSPVTVGSFAVVDEPTAEDSDTEPEEESARNQSVRPERKGRLFRVRS